MIETGKSPFPVPIFFPFSQLGIFSNISTGEWDFSEEGNVCLAHANRIDSGKSARILSLGSSSSTRAFKRARTISYLKKFLISIDIIFQ
jgi:hypothetical protein